MTWCAQELHLHTVAAIITLLVGSDYHLYPMTATTARICTGKYREETRAPHAEEGMPPPTRLRRYSLFIYRCSVLDLNMHTPVSSSGP